MVDVARLRADLLDARKARDKVTEVALKRALAAFDNAAAPPAESVVNLHGSGPREVPRLELSPGDLARVLRAEIAEGEAACEHYEAAGHADAAARLRAECAVLARYLS